MNCVLTLWPLQTCLCAWAQVASPAEAPALTSRASHWIYLLCVFLNVLVCSLSPFIIYINICLALSDSWSDFCKVRATGEKWGQVAEEELSYSFSVFSVFLNCWHHSGAFGEWIPGRVLGVFPLRVCIPVFLNFRTIWWGRRDVTADRIKVRAYPAALLKKQWMWVRDWLERVGFGDACGRDM